MARLFLGILMLLLISSGAYARCIDVPGYPRKGTATTYSQTCATRTGENMYATGGGLEFILPFENEQAAIDHWRIITSRPTQSGRGWMCKVAIASPDVTPSPPTPKYYCSVQCCN